MCRGCTSLRDTKLKLKEEVEHLILHKQLIIRETIFLQHTVTEVRRCIYPKLTSEGTYRPRSLILPPEILLIIYDQLYQELELKRTKYSIIEKDLNDKIERIRRIDNIF